MCIYFIGYDIILIRGDKMSIGANIKKTRKKNKMTQVQLASKLNKSESIIRKYESNSVTPSLYVLNQIAKIFNCNLEDLISPSNIQLESTSYKLIILIQKNLNMPSAISNKDNVLDTIVEKLNYLDSTYVIEYVDQLLHDNKSIQLPEDIFNGLLQLLQTLNNDDYVNFNQYLLSMNADSVTNHNEIKINAFLNFVNCLNMHAFNRLDSCQLLNIINSPYLYKFLCTILNMEITKNEVNALEEQKQAKVKKIDNLLDDINNFI